MALVSGLDWARSSNSWVSALSWPLRDEITGYRDGGIGPNVVPMVGHGTVRGYRPRELVGPIQQGDREVRLPAQGLSITPTEKDQVLIAGTVYNIEGVNTRAVRGMEAIHILRVRG